MGQTFQINPRTPLNIVPAQAYRNPVFPAAQRRLAGVTMRVRPLSGARFLGSYADTLPPFDASDPTVRNLAIAHAILTDPQAAADFAAQGGAAYANAIIANGGVLPGVSMVAPPQPVAKPPVAVSTLPPPRFLGPPVQNTAVTVAWLIPLGSAGTQVMYTDGTSAIWPASVAPPAVGSAKTPPPGAAASGGSTSTAGNGTNPVVSAAQVYHYNDGSNTYSIYIVSVGTGGPGGLQTTEGVQLPIGTVYRITSGAGANEIWQSTGPNSATHRTDLETGAAGSSSGSGDSSGSGNQTSTAAAPGWLTDPNREVISGVPNWGLVAGAGVGAFLLFKKK